MTTLLTLDPTTLFFYSLCLSSQNHATSIKNWRSRIETDINPSAYSTSIPTVPPLSLTHGSTHSSVMLNSKWWIATDDSVIDLSGPTPKNLRTYTPMLTSKPLTNNIIKIAVDDDESKGDVYGCGLSDRDEVSGIEALAACVSPIKHRAWATNSVSNLFKYWLLQIKRSCWSENGVYNSGCWPSSPIPFPSYLAASTWTPT